MLSHCSISWSNLLVFVFLVCNESLMNYNQHDVNSVEGDVEEVMICTTSSNFFTLVLHAYTYNHKTILLTIKSNSVDFSSFKKVQWQLLLCTMLC